MRGEMKREKLPLEKYFPSGVGWVRMGATQS
jgi:hypothetical protein